MVGSESTARVDQARMLRIRDVTSVTGLSAVTIWRRVRAGEFPSPRHLGANAVGWLSTEVTAWITSRPARAAVPQLRSPRGAPPPGRGRRGRRARRHRNGG